MYTQYLIENSVITEEFDDELIVHNIMSGETLLLNSTAMLVYQNVKAGYTRDEMVNRIANIYSTPVDVIQNDVNDVIDYLASHGVIKSY